MDRLEGYLLVPPDRSQILGRAVWKTRYVVASQKSIVNRDHQSSSSISQLKSGRTQGTPSTLPSKNSTEEYSLAIYKSKDDWEPIQQWLLSSVVECQIQSLAHRKQGPVLPTLVVTMSDKERKRRSSRAAGLMSSKDSSAVTLWFRTPQDDHHHGLQEWARFIITKRGIVSTDSPISPNSNPFARARDASEYSSRPGSDNPNNRSLHHKSSTATYSTGPRDRPYTLSSDSPSLKSKRSDVSSPSSYNMPSHQLAGFTIPGQHYTTVLPSDIPSPTSPAGEYRGDFIEGWTAAQGRSSTMSSPTHGRDSISSHAHQPSITESSSPPGPRETILDRAFQLRVIPGSEDEVPGEEKLSSLARFDALMREADARRRQREAAEKADQNTMRSAFEADDSSDAEERDDDESSDTDTDDDNYVHEHDHRGSPSLIPPNARRALDFIAERNQVQPASPVSPRQYMSRNPVSFHASSSTLLTQGPPLRPHTSHSKNRPSPAQRIYSISQLPHAATTVDVPALATKTSEDGTLRPSLEKRQSSSSTKRLSFTEFTKRLSSTSSLLLVQTNVSGGSSRGSNDADPQSISASASRTSMSVCGTGQPSSSGQDRDDNDPKCGWRGSVGVIGTEGGFL